MQWKDVLADESLQDLPYKIELNERGNIEMRPASNKHGAIQSELIYIFRSHLKNGQITFYDIDGERTNSQFDINIDKITLNI